MILADHEKGFSAIELAIVLALTGLVAAIALPRWRVLVQSYELNNSARQIQSELHNLKSRAAAENVNFQLVYEQGGDGLHDSAGKCRAGYQIIGRGYDHH